MQQTLLGLSLLFSIGTIIGASILLDSGAKYGDPFVFSNAYPFYWFTVCLSFFISSVGLFYHNPHGNNELSRRSLLAETDNIKNYNIMFCISFVLATFWLALSVCLCLVIITTCNFNQRSCDGEIVSGVFSFLLFLVWLTTLIRVSFLIQLQRGRFVQINDQDPDDV
jgi:hypothetical protein